MPGNQDKWYWVRFCIETERISVYFTDFEVFCYCSDCSLENTSKELNKSVLHDTNGEFCCMLEDYFKMFH